MLVKDVMTKKVLSVERHCSLAQAGDVMRRRHIRHLVVVDGTQVAGLVTPELVTWGEAEGIARVEDVMLRHLASGTPEMTIRDAANLLRDRTAGALPIFSHDRLVGIVTVSDLLDLIGRGAEGHGRESFRRSRPPRVGSGAPAGSTCSRRRTVS
jgi:CBS domain-containing protein